MTTIRNLASTFFAIVCLSYISTDGLTQPGEPSSIVRLLAELGPSRRSYAVDFSADGKYLLSAAEVPTGDPAAPTKVFVTKWDVEEKTAIWNVDSCHPAMITLLGFSPSGDSFFIGDYCANVSIWKDKDCVGFFKGTNKSPGLLFGYFVDQDNLFIMDGMSVGLLRNIKTQESNTYIIPRGKTKDKWSRPGTFSRQKQHIAVVKLNVAELVKQNRAEPVKQNLAAPVKQNLAAPVKENLVGFKNGLELQEDYEIALPIEHVGVIAMSDDGSLITGAGHPGRLFQYDVRQKKFTKEWDSRLLAPAKKGYPFPGDTYAIQYLHNSSSFITAHESGTVRIWKEPGVLLASIRVADYAVAALAVSPDNRMLATAGDIQPAKLWDISGLDFVKLPK